MENGEWAVELSWSRDHIYFLAKPYLSYVDDEWYWLQYC